ncbi:AAA family ATPase, partial [Cronobacter dublinensis]
NFFEAIIEIFRHIDQFGQQNNIISFEYRIFYEIDGVVTKIEWTKDRLFINDEDDQRKLGKIPFPENILVYYTGHNTTVSSLISNYKSLFQRKIKGADLSDSRKFIGIGPDYKSLLLTLIISQHKDNPARNYILNKLSVSKLGLTKPGTKEVTEPVIRLKLERPNYARGKKDFNIQLNDETDRYWKVVGITKEFLESLTQCVWNNTDQISINEGYFQDDDSYILYISIYKLQKKFENRWGELFQHFDNLKVLGMLSDMTVPLRLDSGIEGDISSFSDGQFQSVYIYAVSEFFKNKNCVTLLDEPDAFLHPEWQHQFISQVKEINTATLCKNHILVTTHSASTIASLEQKYISVIYYDNHKVKFCKRDKGQVIRDLSAGVISFSETEARLVLNQFLKTSSGNVLFTEGVTDEIILTIAWDKLNPGRSCPFGIQNAFDRTFLRNLFSRDELKLNFPNRKMFALFDFDDAYNDWKGLKGLNLVVDPFVGLAKKLEYEYHYALLLPVPKHGDIKKQVIDEKNHAWGGNGGSHLSIELLFYKEDLLDKWFVKRPFTAGSEIIEFVGDKADFAKTMVPTFPTESFEIFRPLFDFIESKCHA